MGKKMCVIGGGPMGLALAYRLLQHGHAVDLFEADDRLGGMSASFDFDGVRLERYYHFVCGPDSHTFRLLDELGIGDRLTWTETRMGFFYDGTLYPWGDPVALLALPRLTLTEKLRYGLFTAYAASRGDLSSLDDVSAYEWIKKWVGERCFDVTWKFLMDKKLFDHAPSVSAAWIASRIRRVAHSRSSIFTEKMGYLRGGTEALLATLSLRITSLGGSIFLSNPVEGIETTKQGATGVRVSGRNRRYDVVASTIPLPYLPALVSGPPSQHLRRIARIRNIGVVCTVLKLDRRFSEYFWINTNDERIKTPGIIEYTNLRPPEHNAHIVYIPSYVPSNHRRSRMGEDAFIDESARYLSMIDPDFSSSSILSGRTFRYRYAQPICSVGFGGRLPGYRSDIPGLYIGDTSHSYPEDRSINESVRIADEMGRVIIEDIE